MDPATQNRSAADTPAPFVMHSRIGARSLRDSLVFNGWSLAIFALGSCWFLFFNALRGEWEVNPQYNYGYVVPLLGLALFWRRWTDRPAARPGTVTTAALVAAGPVLLLLPLDLVYEANPEWRLLYWVHGFVVVALSLCLMYRAGGVTWVRYFAPPALFTLIAIPWPMQLEQTTTQGLMRLVAGLTVELAGWLGIPALQHGNLVEIGTGTVGIDEACSGVRSLQSALMLSLFLGELNRFGAWRRVGLVLGSFAVAVIANVARTTFLTWEAANHGLAQMERAHDTAGLLVMIIVLPALVGLAHFMKPRIPRPLPPAGPSPVLLSRMPRWVGLTVLAWLAFSSAVTELWYRAHETDLLANVRWSVSWPTSSPHFKRTALPETSLAILRCSSNESASWLDDEGNQWGGFFLRWAPGKNSAQLAKGHRPEICLPATGARQLDDFGTVRTEVNGVLLSFRHESFESNAGILNVFYCLWSDRSARNEHAVLEDWSQSSRLQAVLAGKRHLGQQVLELVVAGPDTSEAALVLFRHELPVLIRMDKVSAPGGRERVDSIVTIFPEERLDGRR